jgi:polyketide cyclase/dehydrase/lipid transport protein
LHDLDNHWLLADRFIEVVHLDGAGEGGKVRLRGPLGLGRTVTTRVVTAEPASSIVGTAGLSGGTQATVRWTLTPAEGGTLVELAAFVERAGTLDRLLLAAGARRWLRRRFSSILARLAQRF